MFSKSTLLHLRFPFSYFLLPVFLFALSISPNLISARIGWAFFILHFLLYPASNGYNSYFDKDEGSIGGLKNPPPVNKGLYWMSLLLDLGAITLGYFKVSALFSVMLLMYGLASKAYSHPAIRLKQYAFNGWMITGLFQGLFTFLMCYAGMNNFGIENLVQEKVLLAGLLTSVMLWANYPMTQVYQHEEDARHGDRTLSLVLGIRGTFYFTGLFFALATLGFIWFFSTYYESKYAWSFFFWLSPAVLYFVYWFLKVFRNEKKADFRHTMWLNFVSATGLIVFFVRFFLAVSHLGS